MTSEADRTLIAAFLRNLMEGRPSSTEEWKAIWQFLEDGSVIARRTDWRYRTHEFFPELERLRSGKAWIAISQVKELPDEKIPVKGSIDLSLAK